jgi:cell wall-associated NlpC family hydrolase
MSLAKKVLLLTFVLIAIQICILQQNKVYASTSSSKKAALKKTYATVTNKQYKVASRGFFTPAGSADVKSVISYAQKYLGIKYTYGASGPYSFDCSGFTQYIMKNHGIHLPHSARAQSAYGVVISRKNIRPGDLVFFTTSGDGQIYM